jgi:hypothetical protein
VRRLLVVLCACAAVAAAGAGRAAATNECRGLQVCVPIAGPWVLVPSTARVPRQQAQFQLACPKGMVAGGLDAELSVRPIDVSFLGQLGSPVNPGITTSGEVVFLGTFVGASASAPSFRPHVGCMPTPGGGGRVPTSASVFPPLKVTVRHVVDEILPDPRVRHVVVRCAANERLVDGYATAAFTDVAPPTAHAAAGVAFTKRLVGGRVLVTARANEAASIAGALVQVGAVCAGGK